MNIVENDRFIKKREDESSESISLWSSTEPDSFDIIKISFTETTEMDAIKNQWCTILQPEPDCN